MSMGDFIIPGARMWVFALVVVFGTMGQVDADTSEGLSLSSRIMPQGGIVSVTVSAQAGERPLVTWLDRKVILFQERKEVSSAGRLVDLWYGFVGADLTTVPGTHDLKITMMPSGHEGIMSLTVTPYDYGVRNLTLPREMVDLEPEALARVKRETAVMERLWVAAPSQPMWSGPFQMPLQGEVVGTFGRRSIINHQPRSPHSGVDLSAERGEPVSAMNAGRVILTANHFFSGKSLVVDHGGGIQSMYFHLDRFLVQETQIVSKKQVIGHVGSTGRATGPHLHWGIRVNGARVDPLVLITLSEKLR